MVKEPSLCSGKWYAIEEYGLSKPNSTLDFSDSENKLPIAFNLVVFAIPLNYFSADTTGTSTTNK
ncbi:hypothetical protein GCM10007876_41040 [Litoribrevibacter albus]|uniref:Uncharacterized protein n=1 Tax=Litoribrevibacter albus TaxID=1473156 RepID=A0AA37SDR6_9GAMM|nr:hypothetical protein GCM10007876_41040 [Litoribrevibacter albus]